MLWFVEIGQMPAWALLIVLVREFAVSGLRMIASDKGRVIAAGWSGKVKTASTMVCIVLMFLPDPRLAQYRVRGGHRHHHPVFRRGILRAEPGRDRFGLKSKIENEKARERKFPCFLTLNLTFSILAQLPDLGLNAF